MNGTSAFATLTVIIIITKYKINNYFYISIPYLLIAIVNVIYSSLDYHNFIVESIFSIILRYLSDLSYSLFLIWAIEAFPTVCRGRCLGLTLCGSSLGSIIAYSLKSTELSQYILSLLLTIMVAFLSKYFSLDYENKLRDTLTNEYYDEKDRFKSVWNIYLILIFLIFLYKIIYELLKNPWRFSQKHIRSSSCFQRSRKLVAWDLC